MAEPLNESEWSKFWSLLASPARTREMHDELAGLHAKAQAYIDEWQPDAKAAAAHLVGVIEHLFGAVQQIASILPAAGALMAKLPIIQSAVENASVALKGPANIPPMPDPPPVDTAPGTDGVHQEAPASVPTDGAPVSSGGAEAPQPDESAAARDSDHS